MSTPPDALPKHKWVIEAFDLHVKPAELMPRPSASASKTAPLLDPAQAKAATGPAQGQAQAMSMADLAKLHKLAGTLRDKAAAMKKPDPEAEGAEWDGVIAACKTVEAALTKSELRQSDIDTATQHLVQVGTAQTAALKSIQERLRLAAKALVDKLPALEKADTDVEGTEWDGVVAACKSVEAALNKPELKRADIQAAQQRLLQAVTAQTAARKSIQDRLALAAKALLDKLPPLKQPDPDAGPKEWDTVLAACKQVESALPKAGLSKAILAQAQQAFDNIAVVAAAAKTAIRERLKTEAQVLRDDAAVKAKREVDAIGNEWKMVDAALKATLDALPADGLNTACIVEGKKKLSMLGMTAGLARGTIRDRLAKEAKELKDKVLPFRAADAEARGDEWAIVTAACDRVEAALPPVGLTGAKVAEASLLLKRLPVFVQTSKAKTQARLSREAGAVRTDLKVYQTAPAGVEADWGPVLTACEEVDAQLKKTPLAAADITEAKRLLDLVPATALPVYAALCVKDTLAAKNKVNDLVRDKATLLTSFMSSDPLAAQFGARVKLVLSPANAAEYGKEKASLDQLTEAMCAKVTVLKETLTQKGLTAKSPAEEVKAALEARNRSHKTQYAYEQVRQRATAEITACAAVLDRAKKKYSFTGLFDEADELLAEAAKAMATCITNLTNMRDKDWPKASFIAKAQGADFDEGSMNSALQLIQSEGWSKGVDKIATIRLAQDKKVSDALATYGNSAAKAEPLEVLEALAAAVRKHLLSTTAIGIRNKLSQGEKKYPAAIWEKALDEALRAQIAKPVSGTVWAGRFGLSTDGGDSYGVDDTGDVDGKTTHLTVYPRKVSSSCAGTPDEIVDAIIGKDVTGIHVTQEWYSKDDPSNPHVFRGAVRNLKGLKSTEDAMRLILDDHVADYAPIAKTWKDRAGLDEKQVEANQKYLATIEEEIDKLS